MPILQVKKLKQRGFWWFGGGDKGTTRAEFTASRVQHLLLSAICSCSVIELGTADFCVHATRCS